MLPYMVTFDKYIDINIYRWNVAILVVKELCPNLSTDLGSSNMAEFFQESMTYQI